MLWIDASHSRNVRVRELVPKSSALVLDAEVCAPDFAQAAEPDGLQ